jgi:hypothetical protein
MKLRDRIGLVWKAMTFTDDWLKVLEQASGVISGHLQVSPSMLKAQCVSSRSTPASGSFHIRLRHYLWIFTNASMSAVVKSHELMQIITYYILNQMFGNPPFFGVSRCWYTF